jgi:hypothetical protein
MCRRPRAGQRCDRQGPAFKSDNVFLTASAWIVEFAVANADLLEDFAYYQGGDAEFVVLFNQS